MSNPNYDLFNAEASAKDAERLVGSYGKQIDAEKKVALLGKLEAERGGIEQSELKKTKRKQDREFGH